METSKKPEIGDTIKLSRQEVLGEISIDSVKREYSGSRLGQFYYIGTCKGVGFTASEEMYEAMELGDVAEVTLEFKKYMRKVQDAANPGQMKDVEREGWTVLGFTTYKKLKGMNRNLAEINLIDKEADLEYRIKFATKLKDLQLDDKTMELLKTAV